MKTLKILLLALAAMAMVVAQTSCDPEKKFAVKPSGSTEFAFNGGSIELQLSNVKGTWTVDAKPSWVKISPESGDASALTVTVTAERNETTDARTGTITITCNGTTVDIPVTQVGNTDFLVAPSKPSEVPFGGGSIELKISGVTGTWSIQSKPDWVTANPNSGGTSTVIVTLTVAKNNKQTARSEKIVFKCGDQTAEVSISQAANPNVVDCTGKLDISGDDWGFIFNDPAPSGLFAKETDTVFTEIGYYETITRVEGSCDQFNVAAILSTLTDKSGNSLNEAQPIIKYDEAENIFFIDAIENLGVTNIYGADYANLPVSQVPMAVAMINDTVRYWPLDESLGLGYDERGVIDGGYNFELSGTQYGTVIAKAALGTMVTVQGRQYIHFVYVYPYWVKTALAAPQKESRAKAPKKTIKVSAKQATELKMFDKNL